MYFNKVLLTAPILFALGSAGCHKGGPNSDLQIAVEHLGDASDWMQGYFADGQIKWFCIPDFSTGNSWHYTITVKGRTASFDYDTIHGKLGRQITNPDNGISCPHGGAHDEFPGAEFNVASVPGTCYDQQYYKDHPQHVPSGHVDPQPSNVKCNYVGGSQDKVECKYA